MSELRTHSLRHNSWGGADPNIEMFADGSTSINDLRNFGNSLVINGAMNVAQRGTSETGVSVGGYYCVDRMRYSTSNLGTLRTTVSQDTASPAGFSHSLKVEVTTAQAGATNSGLRVQYRMEGQDLQHLEWGTANAKSLSVSFWVRSSVAGAYAYQLFRDEATDRNIGTTFTISADEAANNTWKQITHTFAGDQTTAITDDTDWRLQLSISLVAGTDLRTTDNTSWANYALGRYAFGHTAAFSATAGNEFYITGLQITATPTQVDFQHESYGDTLLKCRRYYTAAVASALVMNTASTGGSTAYGTIPLGVPMRVNDPTVENGDTIVFIDRSGGTTTDSSINEQTYAMTGSVRIRFDRTTSTADTYKRVSKIKDSGTNVEADQIRLSAEL